MDELCGDASKAKQKLGWVSSISLEELASEMISFDMKESKKELILKKNNLKDSND